MPYHHHSSDADRAAPEAERHSWTPTHWAMALLAVLGLMVVALPIVVSPPLGQRGLAPQTISAAASLPAAGGWIPSESTWGDELRATWRSPGPSAPTGTSIWSSTPRSGLISAVPDFRPGKLRNSTRSLSDTDDEDSSRSSGRTYRTMCVRLCDGYYWPINYAVTKDRFGHDAAACEQACGGPSEAKLFVYRNPGSDIEDMEDLDGRAYKKLQKAFLFRTKYEPSCKCRPHPWEDASAARHATYALVAKAETGDKVAQMQLREQRIKAQNEARAALKAKSKTDKTAAAKPEKATEAVVDEKFASDRLPGEASPASKPTLIRGDQKQAGYSRAPQSRATASQSEPKVTVQTRVPDQVSGTVRLRLGGRDVRDVSVPRSMRSQKAAQAGDGLVVKQ